VTHQDYTVSGFNYT